MMFIVISRTICVLIHVSGLITNVNFSKIKISLEIKGNNIYDPESLLYDYINI